MIAGLVGRITEVGLASAVTVANPCPLLKKQGAIRVTILSRHLPRMRKPH
jgi:hypothetical protein